MTQKIIFEKKIENNIWNSETEFNSWPNKWLLNEKVTEEVLLTRQVRTQWTQTSLGRLTTKPDVFTTSGRRSRIYDVLKTSYLRRLEDVRFITSWRRLFYDVLKTSDLRRLEDVGFTSSWRRLIHNVLKTSDLRLLDDLCKTTSVDEKTSAQRQKKLFFLISYCLKCWENFKYSGKVSIKVWNFVNY